jgi:hypothetical protein
MYSNSLSSGSTVSVFSSFGKFGSEMVMRQGFELESQWIGRMQCGAPLKS